MTEWDHSRSGLSSTSDTNLPQEIASAATLSSPSMWVAQNQKLNDAAIKNKQRSKCKGSPLWHAQY